MIPQAFSIGPLEIHFYGIFMGVAMMVGGSLAARYATRFQAPDTAFQITAADVWDGLLWGVIFGIIGARAYHVIDLWAYYSAHPAQIFAVWKGGLGIFGALGGGLIGLALFTRGKLASLLALMDVAAFGLPVAQAIGRLGNFVNQELYGRPTDLPWGIYIEEPFRVAGYENFSRFHPLFAYEGLLNLLVFGVLAYLARRRAFEPGTGKYFAVYMFGYGFVRFWLEFLRIEPWTIGEIPTAQIISVALMVGSVLWLVVKREKAGESQADQE